MPIDPIGPAKEIGKSLAPKVYEDGLQPAVVEIGRTLGGVVRAALSPINGLVWTVDQARVWLENAATELLQKRKTPPELVITPRPQIIDGVIRGVRSAGPEPDPALRELYASLFATAMDQRTAPAAHPAFADILQQIVSDEARIIRLLAKNDGRVVVSVLVADAIPFEDIDDTLHHSETLGAEAECHYPDLIPSYIDNLKRLGIVDDEEESITAKNRKSLMREMFSPTVPDSKSDQRAEEETRKWLERYPYDPVREALTVFEVSSHVREGAAGDSRIELLVDFLFLTSFGEQFVRACVADTALQDREVSDDEYDPDAAHNAT